MCKPKSRIFCFILLLSSLLALSGILSGNASAYDFTFIAEAVNDSGGVPYCRFYYTGGTVRWGAYGTGSSLAIGANTGNDADSISSIQCRHIADDVRIEELQYVEMVVRVKTDAFHPSSQYYQNTGYFSTVLTGPQYVNDGWFRGVYSEQIGVEENYNERYEYWRLVTRYSEHGWVNYVEAPFKFFNDSVQSPMQIRVLSWTIWKPRDLLTDDDRTFLEALLEEHTSQESFSEALENQKEEEREELEDEQSNAEDSADDSGAEAEATGQSLLAAFTGFVNAVTNADATNCTIPGNLGNFNMGNLNLCRDNPPALVQTIGSIFMILFFVPLSYATATKVIALFRSFQS